MDEATDRQTLNAMGRIYCRAHHKDAAHNEAGLCEECQQIAEYALGRAQECPTGHSHNCNDCPTPCYQAEKRAGIKRIMKYAAPRMLLRHPVLTFRYARKKL